MAKKSTIICQFCLAVFTVLTLGYAANYTPVYACGEANGETAVDNCEEASKDKPMLIAEDLTEDSSDDYYFGAATNINSDVDVDHSLFLAGNEVSSNDRINGLGFIAGNLVRFSGKADYGFLAGSSVNVSGEVKKDLFAAGSTVEITDSASIGRDVFVAGETVLVKTNLSGNAFIGGNRVVLENITIDGNTTIEAEEIVVKGRVAIAGKLKHNEDARISGSENLSYGSLEKTSAIETSSAHRPVNSFLTKIKTTLFFLVGRIVVTIILVAVASKFSKKMLDNFELKNSWKDLALGLGLIIGLPLAIIFVCITLIGLPLGLVTLTFYGLAIYFAKSVTGGVVGDVLAKKLFKKDKMNILAKYTIGTILVVLLGLLPYIGGLISAVAVCFGFGYLIHNLFRKETKPAKQ